MDLAVSVDTETAAKREYWFATHIDRLGVGILIQTLIYPWALTDYLEPAEWRNLRCVGKDVRTALFVIWRAALPTTLRSNYR